MASLHERVINALSPRLRELVDGLDDIEELDRVTGFVVSPDFIDVDDRERQERLWGILEGELSAEVLQCVGPIVAMTPAEAQVPRN